MKSGNPDFTQELLNLMGDENIEEIECLFAIGFALTTGAFTKPADLLMITYQSH